MACVAHTDRNNPVLIYTIDECSEERGHRMDERRCDLTSCFWVGSNSIQSGPPHSAAQRKAEVPLVFLEGHA